MNTSEAVAPLHVYFLLDQTGELSAQLDSVEDNVDNLFRKLQRMTAGVQSPRLQVIGMGRATVQVTELVTTRRFRLTTHSGCDLGQALKIVQASIKQAPDARYELFILLTHEPGGEWRHQASSLKRLPNIRLSALGFGGPHKISEYTLAYLSSGRETMHRFEEPTSEPLAHAFRQIASALGNVLDQARLPTLTPLGTRPKPAGSPAQNHPGGLGAGESPPGAAAPEERAPDATVTVAPKPVPATEGGVATIWKELDPDPNAPYPVEHFLTGAMKLPDNWRLIGASRRGKMHAHKGIFREDSFALGEMGGWHLIVVADGGGSNAYSRVGAKVAAAVGIQTLKEVIEHESPTPPADLREVCQRALASAITDAWQALKAKAEEMQVAFADLGTTFLAVMYQPAENLVGVAQIGDGVLAAETEDGDTVVLAEPDVGATASVTWFLTSKHWKEWQARVRVMRVDGKLRLLTAMSDGVADDFIPYDQHLSVLFDNIKQKVLAESQPEDALLAFLNYEKRGSFDDRTLTLIYQSPMPEAPLLTLSTTLPQAPAVHDPAETGSVAAESPAPDATSLSLTLAAHGPVETVSAAETSPAPDTTSPPPAPAAHDLVQTVSAAEAPPSPRVTPLLPAPAADDPVQTAPSTTPDGTHESQQ